MARAAFIMDKLMHKIGLPNIGVCLDLGNSIDYGVCPEVFTGAFASITKHVHVKDMVKGDCNVYPGEGWSTAVDGKWLKYCIPGTGIVNMEKIFNMLLVAGYDGYFSLENQNAIYNLKSEFADEDIAIAFKNIERAYNRAKASVR